MSPSFCAGKLGASRLQSRLVQFDVVPCEGALLMCHLDLDGSALSDPGDAIWPDPPGPQLVWPFLPMDQYRIPHLDSLLSVLRNFLRPHPPGGTIFA